MNKYMPELTTWSDWDSFAFWRPKNWRDFTIINISFETNPRLWYEVHLAFIGFHLWSFWRREEVEDDIHHKG